MNKEELIGQIIDIFEDELEKRSNITRCEGYALTNRVSIPIYFEDEDSSGVFYGGHYYDEVAKRIEETLKSWGVFNPKLYVLTDVNDDTDEVTYYVSTSQWEGFIDEDIWLTLGITSDKFYEIADKFNPCYYRHVFNYPDGSSKAVCDTYFKHRVEAEAFMNCLLNESRNN